MPILHKVSDSASRIETQSAESEMVLWLWNSGRSPWKRGVEIAGPQWFGDGTREGLNQAKSKWDLRPDMLRANDALGVLSSGERMFLSAMFSFYNAREGGAMLKRCHFQGLSDFDGLDLQRRQVIADLLLNYSGW